MHGCFPIFYARLDMEKLLPHEGKVYIIQKILNEMKNQKYGLLCHYLFLYECYQKYDINPFVLVILAKAKY